MKYDICIHNGLIVTVDENFTIIGNGMVCVGDGKILDVGETQDGGRPPEARETIDAKGGIVMPGLVNTHSHLPMTLFRGLADDLPLETWLNDYIFPAEARFVTPENVKWGTWLSCAELLLSGTTTCCDGYFHEDTVAEAVCKTGMRAVLGQGVVDFPAPGVPDPSGNVEAAALFVEKWKDRHPLIRPSIFCHSPYTCSENTLKSAKAAAKKNGVLFQIHVAETSDEKLKIPGGKELGPVAYLNDAGVLDEDTLAVHSIWIDERDIKILAKHKTAVSHNPESNMKLASGIAPVPDLIKAGVCVGLGTDSPASNNNLDLFLEMDTAAKLHKVKTNDPTVMDAKTTLRAATIKGAEAIGMKEKIGSIETGKQADIIILDTHTPGLVPMFHPVSHLVYSASGAHVRDVLVSGKPVVKNRSLLTMDVEKVMQKVAEIGNLIGNSKKG